MTEREIPKFVSVDDHVVEPPHLFQKWLPKKFQTTRSPRVEHRGIGKMTTSVAPRTSSSGTTTRRRADCGSTRT